jgi:hypothetical protein
MQYEGTEARQRRKAEWLAERNNEPLPTISFLEAADNKHEFIKAILRNIEIPDKATDYVYLDSEVVKSGFGCNLPENVWEWTLLRFNAKQKVSDVALPAEPG